MKKIFNVGFFFLGMLVVFSSCKKVDYINPNDTSYTNDLDQFITIWNGINTSYVLWSFDTTDWDRVYYYYYKVFEDDLSDEEWGDAWRELTSSLIDHHLTLDIRRPSTGHYIHIFPGYVEVCKRPYYHSFVIVDGTFQRMLRSGRVSNENCYYSYSSGLIDSTIAYLHMPSFEFSDTNTAVFSIIDHYKILLRNPKVKATIVDLRGNGGGNAQYLSVLMSCFVDKPYMIGYVQRKIGLGRLDIGMKVPLRIVPDLGALHVDMPIVVISDINTGSEGELVTLAIKMLPNGYFIGERTVGATCPIVNSDPPIPIGYFGYGDGLVSARMGCQLFTGVDGTCYEGYGIEPDNTCYFNKEDWDNGIDNQLECAIQFALEKVQ